MRGTSSGSYRRRASGFTLIELLIVVAVIALLIGILLPALRGARESGWTTICGSNLRQIGTASQLYADTNRSRLWEREQWYKIETAPGSGVYQPGHLFDYCENVDKVAECPKNKRRGANFNETPVPGSARFFNRAIDFDYTLFSRMHGLRMDTDVRMATFKNPAAGSPPNLLTPLNAATMLTPLNGLMIFVEEDTKFNNEQFADGRWGNVDQITSRHGDRGNVHFLDNHVEVFKFNHGPRPDVDEPKDFNCNDVYVLGKRDSWVRAEAVNEQYGRMNNP
ncbi:MAG: type II secretion system protein [Phycisphaerales bacterium]|nr:type II secretion system protein [Phycisphaerales bacterium]